MSKTLLIDTSGKSEFATSSDVISTNTKVGEVAGNSTVSLSNTDNQAKLAPTGKVIDVVNSFSWYAGPKATSAALDRVPCVFLTEREQLLSSLVSGALYYLNAAAEGVKSVGQSATIKSMLGKLTESGAGDNISSVINSLQEFTGGTKSDQNLLAQHNLKSLEGIYFTKPTGFNYRLPMYGSPSSTTGDWEAASSSGGKIRGMVDAAQDVIEEISTAVNFSQPGVYIEKPLYFGNVKGREESITFPLVNTVRRGGQSPVQQNFELLWLLAFQNKPYKTSFARTPPPKIYSVYAPGQFSMPYAFINSMSVKFMGTIRKTKVYVPTGTGEGIIGSKEITTPIPEAYQVTINFRSLVGDYGNSMISGAFSPKIDGQKVTIGNPNA